jgi:hypothetical protein
VRRATLVLATRRGRDIAALAIEGLAAPARLRRTRGSILTFAHEGSEAGSGTRELDAILLVSLPSPTSPVRDEALDLAITEALELDPHDVASVDVRITARPGVLVRGPLALAPLLARTGTEADAGDEDEHEAIDRVDVDDIEIETVVVESEGRRRVIRPVATSVELAERRPPGGGPTAEQLARIERANRSWGRLWAPICGVALGALIAALGVWGETETAVPRIATILGGVVIAATSTAAGVLANIRPDAVRARRARTVAIVTLYIAWTGSMLVAIVVF